MIFLSNDEIKFLKEKILISGNMLLYKKNEITNLPHIDVAAMSQQQKFQDLLLLLWYNSEESVLRITLQKKTDNNMKKS